LVSSSLTKVEISGDATGPRVSIGAATPAAAAGGKAVVRTVMTFFPSLDLTVSMTLPA
jgi:hypothetical protein